MEGRAQQPNTRWLDGLDHSNGEGGRLGELEAQGGDDRQIRAPEASERGLQPQRLPHRAHREDKLSLCQVAGMHLVDVRHAIVVVVERVVLSSPSRSVSNMWSRKSKCSASELINSIR